MRLLGVAALLHVPCVVTAQPQPRPVFTFGEPQAVAEVGPIISAQDHAFFVVTTRSGERWSFSTNGGILELVDARMTHPHAAVSGAAAALGDRLFLQLGTVGHGAELFEYVFGAGFRLVEDLQPGPGSGVLGPMAGAANRLFFTGNDGVHGAELFASDGASVQMVKELIPGDATEGVSNLAPVGDRLLFTVRNEEPGLWISDGTSDGTRQLDVLGRRGSFAFVGETRLLYYVISRGQGPTLRATDGSNGVSMGPLTVGRGVRDGDRLIARGAYDLELSGGLYALTGTVVEQILDLPHPGFDLRAGPEGTFFFSDGQHLFSTDGTLEGTSQLSEAMLSQHYELVEAGGLFYFIGELDSLHLVFATDGTPEGTARVPEILLPPSADGMSRIGRVGEDVLVVSAEGPVFRIPGGGRSADMIGDLVAGRIDGSARILGSTEEALLVGAGAELYRIGSDEQVRLLRQDVSVQEVVPAGGQLYLRLSPRSDVQALLRLDGDALVEVAEARRIESMAALGADLLFTATVQDQVALRLARQAGGIDTLGTYDDLVGLTANDRAVYFAAEEAGQWRVLRGDASGEAPRIVVGLPDRRLHHLVAASRRIYAFTNHPGDGFRLQALDERTGRLEELIRLTAIPTRDDIHVDDDRIFFVTTAGAFASGGTPESTHRLGDSRTETGAILDGRFYWTGEDASAGPEPWVSDGTPEGTTRLLDMAPGRPGSLATPYALGGRLFLAGFSPEHGVEMFRLEGEALVPLEVAPGLSDASPADPVLLGNKLFFTARTADYGRAVWVDDLDDPATQPSANPPGLERAEDGCGCAATRDVARNALFRWWLLLPLAWLRRRAGQRGGACCLGGEADPSPGCAGSTSCTALRPWTPGRSISSGRRGEQAARRCGAVDVSRR